MGYDESLIQKFEKFNRKNLTEENIKKVIQFYEQVEDQSLKIQKEIGIKSRIPISKSFDSKPNTAPKSRFGADQKSGFGFKNSEKSASSSSIAVKQKEVIEGIAGSMSVAGGLMKTSENMADRKREEMRLRLQKLKEARMKLEPKV